MVLRLVVPTSIMLFVSDLNKSTVGAFLKKLHIFVSYITGSFTVYCGVIGNVKPISDFLFDSGDVFGIKMFGVPVNCHFHCLKWIFILYVSMLKPRQRNRVKIIKACCSSIEPTDKP